MHPMYPVHTPEAMPPLRRTGQGAWRSGWRAADWGVSGDGGGDKWGARPADETLSDHVQLQLAACSAPQPAASPPPPCFQSTVASKHWCYQSQAVAPAGKQPAISAVWRPRLAGTGCLPTVSPSVCPT
ncbi:hypothetical protein CDD82_6135 [Ophiocordyceps australis]|uniref:Uncharacterized protein n=1 Tax=Ophiocordyceps australis TaxID=1399860 RepID=A0A2C5YWQ1_9HYPO|nr:hypothetical protein CDD82_6135 [Ophiocordyceps australis]